MKIAILVALARQVEGEFVFINVLKSHTDPGVLRKFLAENPQPRTGKYSGVDCVVEYGIIEDVEVEGTSQ